MSRRLATSCSPVAVAPCRRAGIARARDAAGAKGTTTTIKTI